MVDTKKDSMKYLRLLLLLLLLSTRLISMRRLDYKQDLLDDRNKQLPKTDGYVPVSFHSSASAFIGLLASCYHGE